MNIKAHPMTNADFERELSQALSDYRAVISYRDDRLFTEFLPRGYRMMTLSCVPDEHFHRALIVKCNLGMFITLIDDFADNPELRNKEILEKLYRIPFDDEFLDFDRCTELERAICSLALKLRSNMKRHIGELPGFMPYYDIFKFDFESVLRANQYSELITDHPEIVNPAECAQYGPYNMGMVLAGMIDLMACPSLQDVLGRIRQMFLLGQRYARLCNVLTTLKRETDENDHTNELVSLSRYQSSSLDEQCHQMKTEMADLLGELRAMEIKQFDGEKYVDGLEQLYALHVSMTGTI